MPTVFFQSASPALGSDVFTNVDIKPYTKGKSKFSRLLAYCQKARKVLWVYISGGTVGTGKFTLRYGAVKRVVRGLCTIMLATRLCIDIIAENLQSTHATIGTLNTNIDLQPITDGRWCGPQSEMTLEVTEAPAATLLFGIGLLEAKG